MAYCSLLCQGTACQKLDGQIWVLTFAEVKTKEHRLVKESNKTHMFRMSVPESPQRWGCFKFSSQWMMWSEISDRRGRKMFMEEQHDIKFLIKPLVWFFFFFLNRRSLKDLASFDFCPIRSLIPCTYVGGGTQCSLLAWGRIAYIPRAMFYFMIISSNLLRSYISV